MQRSHSGSGRVMFATFSKLAPRKRGDRCIVVVVVVVGQRSQKTRSALELRRRRPRKVSVSCTGHRLALVLLRQHEGPAGGCGSDAGHQPLAIGAAKVAAGLRTGLRGPDVGATLSYESAAWSPRRETAIERGGVGAWPRHTAIRHCARSRMRRNFAMACQARM